MITYRRLGANGRLGNQLWQIASTVAVALNHDTEPMFPAWDYSEFFNVPNEWFQGAAGQESTDYFAFAPWRDYLQHYPIIERHAELLREVFKPRNPIDLEPFIHAVAPWDAAAVHVRRGDYGEAWRGHGMLSREWYLDNWPTGRVLVFSDEPLWCAQNLPGEVVHFDEVTDFFLMSLCRELVISNSSFAWWSAFLSDADVTYPDPWFVSTPVGNMSVPGWTAVPRAD